MKKTFLTLLIALSLSVPAAASAQFAPVPDRQVIRVSIGSDFTAKGQWTIPFVRDPYDMRFYLPEPNAFGTAASTKYKLVSVVNTATQVPVVATQIYDETLAFQANTDNAARVQTHTVTYTLTPYFKQPVAIYELWIADGISRAEPTISITFPKEWKVLSVWPNEATTSAGSIGIQYSSAHTTAHPVMVAFQTGSGGSVQQYGKYTVSGTPDEVQKIIVALKLIPAVDETMQQNLGFSSPSSVVIVSEDLSVVGAVGHGAEAIAARPNIILFNNKLTKNKTTEELSETLSHELLHLAMYDQKLFSDQQYHASFFDEGIAVYFQTLMHRKIFTDDQKRILNEELGRTFSVSPREATVLYDSNFDVAFDGSRPLGMGASYMHAGLMFARFADIAGVNGYKNLFTALRQARPDRTLYDDSTTILNALERESKMLQSRLKFPGKTENDISGVVSRISRAENDEDRGADIVATYIQKDIKKYFADGSVQPSAPAAVTPTVTPVTQTGTATRLTKNLQLGSSGPEVAALQTFLEIKGFLAMAAGTAKGTFGKVTKAALIAYQKSAGIASTGTVGPKTRAAINAANGL